MFQALFKILQCPFISAQIYEDERSKHLQILKKMFTNKDSVLEFFIHFEDILNTYLNLRKEDDMVDSYVNVDNMYSVKYLKFEDKMYFLISHITHLCLMLKSINFQNFTKDIEETGIIP